MFSRRVKYSKIQAEEIEKSIEGLLKRNNVVIVRTTAVREIGKMQSYNNSVQMTRKAPLWKSKLLIEK